MDELKEIQCSIRIRDAQFASILHIPICVQRIQTRHTYTPPHTHTHTARMPHALLLANITDIGYHKKEHGQW